MKTNSHKPEDEDSSFVDMLINGKELTEDQVESMWAIYPELTVEEFKDD